MNIRNPPNQQSLHIKSQLSSTDLLKAGHRLTEPELLFEKLEDDIIENKDVLFVANFAPRTMMGIESQGMILSAVDDDSSLRVTTTLDEVKSGSQVG